MEQKNKVQERFLLLAVDTGKPGDDVESNLLELGQLVETAGGIPASTVIQNRDTIHPGYYVGKGKLSEIKSFIQEMDIEAVVCDDELSPSQLRHMEEMLDAKILDRTQVILDIFADRAMSREGKIQVEMAQLKYRLSRLSGYYGAFSRLGGGIGTRGPGEKKLETDRRHIRQRINHLSKELAEISAHRSVLREGRKRTGLPVVSLVGYTNAGKSTLLNHLSGASVLAEDKLFATLDTNIKEVDLEGVRFLLSDTVGFIQKLPHHLIKAFQSTLEELGFADILLHVVDASNERRDQQMQTVYQTLDSLKFSQAPIITVYNKTDLSYQNPLPKDDRARKTVAVSALQETGFLELTQAISELLFDKPVSLCIPYSEGSLLKTVYGHCQVLSEESGEEGYLLQCLMDQDMHSRLQKYIR